MPSLGGCFNNNDDIFFLSSAKCKTHLCVQHLDFMNLLDIFLLLELYHCNLHFIKSSVYEC